MAVAPSAAAPEWPPPATATAGTNRESVNPACLLARELHGRRREIQINWTRVVPGRCLYRQRGKNTAALPSSAAIAGERKRRHPKQFLHYTEG